MPAEQPSEPSPRRPERGPIDLESAASPRAPSLPGTVVVRDTDDDLLDVMTADLLLHAQQCVRTFGDFHLALSGGSTPLPFYRRLMYDPAAREFPWRRTHLWIVDERCVPLDDDRSNFKAIEGLIVEQSDIPRVQVHPVPATEPDGADLYERELGETLVWRERGHDRLDYVLLGMGADAHTASLFPRSPALRASLEDLATPRAPGGGVPRRVMANSGEGVTPPPRITMTLSFLNASRFIAVLVTGASKRPTLARVAGVYAGDPSTAPALDLPILGVRPRAGELRWYLDREACPTGTPSGA